MLYSWYHTVFMITFILKLFGKLYLRLLSVEIKLNYSVISARKDEEI